MSMIDDYEESFYYNKPRSVNCEVSGQAVAAGIGLGVGLFGIVVSVLAFIISRIDLASSLILGLLFYLLTFEQKWDKPVYIISELVIIIGSMLLQHYLKVFRVIYVLFISVVASLFGPVLIGYDSDVKMYSIMAICFGVTALWGFLSWKNR